MTEEYIWDKTAMIHIENELTEEQEKDFILDTLTSNIKGFEEKEIDNYIVDIWKKYFKSGDIGYKPGWIYNFRFRDKRTKVILKGSE